MKNPIRFKTEAGEYLYIVQGYVQNVVDRKSYNSVSFKIDSTKPISRENSISVMCFENDTGIDFKKLTARTKGRFLTIIAEKREFNGVTSYKSLAISIAPREFQVETHPVVLEDMDDGILTTADPVGAAQISFEMTSEEIESLPFC